MTYSFSQKRFLGKTFGKVGCQNVLGILLNSMFSEVFRRKRFPNFVLLLGKISFLGKSWDVFGEFLGGYYAKEKLQRKMRKTVIGEVHQHLQNL